MTPSLSYVLSNNWVSTHRAESSCATFTIHAKHMESFSVSGRLNVLRAKMNTDSVQSILNTP
jgi:hypothetical protein